MNLKLIVASLLIVAAPVRAQAQNPSVSKGDAQKDATIISGDKAKTQTYCDLMQLGEQLDEAEEKKDSKKAKELLQKIGELGKKTGSRICRTDGRTSGHRSGRRGRCGDHVSIPGTRQEMYEVSLVCGGTKPQSAFGQ